MILTIFSFIVSLALKALIFVGKPILQGLMSIAKWALSAILGMASKLAVESRAAAVAEIGKLLSEAHAEAEDLVAEAELAIHEALHSGS